MKREIKVADFIVEYFIHKGITDVFGYPGGMVTHLMDSFSKYSEHINAHITYHEQAAVFCACGYAQTTRLPGVAYATSGPGATNMITGICNAFFDSIPIICITGQVNTYESKNKLRIRQNGFQETNIIEMVKSVTKYCKYVSEPADIVNILDKAYHISLEGRPGPVLLDVPMDVFRGYIEIDDNNIMQEDNIYNRKAEDYAMLDKIFPYVIDIVSRSKRPCILIGAGVKNSKCQDTVKTFIKEYNIPIVTSMVAFDVLEYSNINNYGFIGAYGHRYANFIVAKCDLLISIGSRLDIRQIGAKKENFAPSAKIIRIDIDEKEFDRKIKEDELQLECSADSFFDYSKAHKLVFQDTKKWICTCNKIKNILQKYDEQIPNQIMKKLGEKIETITTVMTDVGQNQVWVAQSLQVGQKQNVYFSGGHGAMGYSLPAAIGAYYGVKKPIVSINGDGGIQMNIQELEFVNREKLPISIVVFNNNALGMIRHFQEMYFNGNFYQTVKKEGYSSPDFKKIALAYNLNYIKIKSISDMEELEWDICKPTLIEILLEEETYVYPKIEYGKPNQDQEPLIDREVYNELMEM